MDDHHRLGGRGGRSPPKSSKSLTKPNKEFLLRTAAHTGRLRSNGRTTFLRITNTAHTRSRQFGPRGGATAHHTKEKHSELGGKIVRARKYFCTVIWGLFWPFLKICSRSGFAQFKNQPGYHYTILIEYISLVGVFNSNSINKGLQYKQSDVASRNSDLNGQPYF